MASLPVLNQLSYRDTTNGSGMKSEEYESDEEKKDPGSVPMQIYDHDQSTYHMGIYKSKQAESMKRTMLHKEGKKRHAPFTLA